MKAGAYFFLPGLKALRYLATFKPTGRKQRYGTNACTHLQSKSCARKYTGKRCISIYWTWSYPWESQRDPAEMENRFSTMTEFATCSWPAYETTGVGQGALP